MDRQDVVVEDVPPEVMSEYRNVHIDINIMYVNRVPFVTAISRDLRLIHSEVIRGRSLRKINKEGSLSF